MRNEFLERRLNLTYLQQRGKEDFPAFGRSLRRKLSRYKKCSILNETLSPAKSVLTAQTAGYGFVAVEESTFSLQKGSSQF